MFELLLGLSLSLSQHTEQKPQENNHINVTSAYVEEIPKSPELISSNLPILNANSSLAIDLNSGHTLYQNNIQEKVQIASLTKMMTALIILEETPLADIATVPYEATQIGGSSMHLSTQEEISIHELLHGLLIQSGNDAAISLAIHHSGSVDKFVERMNQKAQELNLNNTHFQNPMGFDHTNNYSTAQDLSLLAQELLQSQTVREIVKKSEYTATSQNGTQHPLKSTNQLLNTYTNIIGLKTGKTDLAQECFVGITNTDSPILTIVLGSQNRFNDTEILLDWIQNSYKFY